MICRVVKAPLRLWPAVCVVLFRVSRRPCEDGPLLEEQETEGQRQLHSLLLQQLHTDVDINRSETLCLYLLSWKYNIIMCGKSLKPNVWVLALFHVSWSRSLNFQLSRVFLPAGPQTKILSDVTSQHIQWTSPTTEGKTLEWNVHVSNKICLLAAALISIMRLYLTSAQYKR